MSLSLSILYFRMHNSLENTNYALKSRRLKVNRQHVYNLAIVIFGGFMSIEAKFWNMHSCAVVDNAVSTIDCCTMPET